MRFVILVLLVLTSVMVNTLVFTNDRAVIVLLNVLVLGALYALDSIMAKVARLRRDIDIGEGLTQLHNHELMK